MLSEKRKGRVAVIAVGTIIDFVRYTPRDDVKNG